MAAPVRLSPLVLTIFVVCYSKGAIVAGKPSLAHSESAQEMTSHELDLSKISLPPEVITEALFSQTDFLQDQLEQCEEMVRNNLKGDDSAETDGIEDEDGDNDNDDDSDDDDQGDDMNRKIAQLAVNAFSHYRTQDDGDVNTHASAKQTVDGDVTTHASSEKTGRVDVNSDHTLKETVDGHESAVNFKSAQGKRKTGNAKEKEENQEEGEEYIVYEYDDAAESNGSVVAEATKNNEQKDGEHSQDPQEQSRKETHNEKDNGKETNTHAELNQATTTTTHPDNSAADLDTKNSDAEEPQSQPEEMSISNENGDSPADKKDVEQVQHKETIRNQVDGHDTVIHTTVASEMNNDTFQSHEDFKTSDMERKGSVMSQATPPSPEGSGTSELQDNDSKEDRIKRSLSLDQVVHGGMKERGAQKEVQEVTFGKGRIRRQASPHDTVKSSLPKHAVEGDTESPAEVINTILGSLLDQRGDPLSRHQEENSPIAPESSRPSELSFLSLNPTWKKTERIEEITLALKKVMTDKNARDVSKLAETLSPENDVTKAEEDKTLLRDVIKRLKLSQTFNVVKMAEKYLESLRESQHQNQGLRQTDDTEALRHLAASSRFPSGRVKEETGKRGLRRHRRQSALSRDASPERFVPLIEQLVERLNYLQHSVSVCHRLLPHHRLSENGTVVV